MSATLKMLEIFQDFMKTKASEDSIMECFLSDNREITPDEFQEMQDNLDSLREYSDEYLPSQLVELLSTDHTALVPSVLPSRELRIFAYKAMCDVIGKTRTSLEEVQTNAERLHMTFCKKLHANNICKWLDEKDEDGIDDWYAQTHYEYFAKAFNLFTSGFDVETFLKMYYVIEHDEIPE